VLANAVARAWAGRNDPIVIVADRAHMGRFRKAAHKLNGLLAAGVEHPPEGMNESELHAQVWPLVRAHIRGSDQATLKLVRDGVTHGGTVAGLAAASAAALA